MTDPRLDSRFSGSGALQDAKRALRALLLDCAVTEEMKWGQPCYTAQGRNLAILAIHKESVVLSFLSGALLSDPEQLLEPPGPNSRSARVMRLDSVEAVTTRAETIRAYVAEAVAHAVAGRRVELPDDDFDLPGELVDALAADPDLAAAWDALTPGRRRGWVLHVAQAKQGATRASRVEKATPGIMAGKGMHDR